MLRTDRPIRIAAGWVVDGSGGPVRQNMLVTVQAGRFESVKPLSNADRRLPELTDLTDHTLVPGLVDSHVHLFMSATVDAAVRERQLRARYETLLPVIRRHAAAHGANGVVLVRDGGDYGGFALRYRSESGVGNPPVRILAAGRAWRKPGRYGRLIGRSPREGQTLAAAIAESRESVDHVKLVNSGINSLRTFGRQTAPQFTKAELLAAVRAAGAQGRRVMVHANGEVPVRLAVEAGCHSIEHGFFMGRDNLMLMAGRQTAWVPTLMTMKAYAEVAAPGTREQDVCLRNLEHQIAQVREGRRLGVNIVLGTDAGSTGVYHGAAVREEMQLLMDAGFTVSEAVRAASLAGTELAGFGVTGSIASGHAASFLAVDGNPSDLPDSLARIRFRMVDGRPIDP